MEQHGSITPQYKINDVVKLLKLGESFEVARFAAQILLINVNGIHIDNFLIENP